MNFYTLISLLLSLAALLGYLNSRYFKLPSTIAIMVGALLISLALVIVGELGFEAYEERIVSLLTQLDFNKLLLEGMLSFLLFAGALTVDVNFLKQRKWEIAVLASFGTVASALLIGSVSYCLFLLLNLNIPYIYCLLFGSLISPTDPVAVLAIFKKLEVSKTLNVTITGESLFNDGVAIVMFLTFYHLATGAETYTWQSVSLLFLRETGGGIVYGIALGLFGYELIKPLDDYKTEILITIAMATGGYVFAEILGVSGPLAMVTAGLFIGNRGRNFSMSAQTRRNLDNFWELIDEVLNALLFLIIGLELVAITHARGQVIAAVIAIPLTLIVRYITVAIPISLFKLRKKYVPHFINIVSWGGIRGGLAVALALALPLGPYRDTIISMTYAVVVFSILVQGLTIKRVIQLSKK